MKRRSAQLLSLAAGSLLALVGTTAAGASAAHHAAAGGRGGTPRAGGPSALAAFVYDDGSSQSTYDSAGGAVAITRLAAGQYQVSFAGLGSVTGGHAEVSSASDGTTCSVVEWGSDPPDLVVGVECYDYIGNLTDSGFSLTFTQPTAAPHGVLAYNWIAYPRKSYTLSGTYQYNSTHHQDRIAHLGAGRYKVTMPIGSLPNTMTGTMKVSAYNSGGGDCLLKSWGYTTGGIVSYVDCYSAAGAPHDRQFDIEYARGNNLLGLNGATDANADASKPNAALYAPKVQYDSASGAKVWSVLLDKGQYVAFFTGSQGDSGNVNGGGGDVQVTPISSAYVHCAVVARKQELNPYAAIDCADNNGDPVNAQYTVQWVVP